MAFGLVTRNAWRRVLSVQSFQPVPEFECGEQKAGSLWKGLAVTDGATPNLGARLIRGLAALDKCVNRLIEVTAHVQVEGPDGFRWNKRPHSVIVDNRRS